MDSVPLACQRKPFRHSTSRAQGRNPTCQEQRGVTPHDSQRPGQGQKVPRGEDCEQWTGREDRGVDTAVLTVPAWHTCSTGQACTAGHSQPSPSPGESGSSPHLSEEMRLSARSSSQAPGPPLTALPAGGNVSSLFPAQIAAAAKSQYNKNLLYWLKNVDTGLRMQLSDTSHPAGLWGGGSLAPSHQGCWLMATQAAERGAGGLRVLRASGCCVLPLDPCPPRSL